MPLLQHRGCFTASEFARIETESNRRASGLNRVLYQLELSILVRGLSDEALLCPAHPPGAYVGRLTPKCLPSPATLYMMTGPSCAHPRAALVGP